MKSILDPSFRYVPSVKTNIAERPEFVAAFAALRAQQAAKLAARIRADAPDVDRVPVLKEIQ